MGIIILVFLDISFTSFSCPAVKPAALASECLFLSNSWGFFCQDGLNETILYGDMKNLFYK